MGVGLSNPISHFFLIPVGGIIMWYGPIASIPAGYHICDGTAGTPDLRNRFTVCADVDSGGVPMTHILGPAQSTGGSVDHSHGINLPNCPLNVSDKIVDSTPLGYYADTVTVSGTTTTEANVPPFYALAYIMRLV